MDSSKAGGEERIVMEASKADGGIGREGKTGGADKDRMDSKGLLGEGKHL